MLFDCIEDIEGAPFPQPGFLIRGTEEELTELRWALFAKLGNDSYFHSIPINNYKIEIIE